MTGVAAEGSWGRGPWASLETLPRPPGRREMQGSVSVTGLKETLGPPSRTLNTKPLTLSWPQRTCPAVRYWTESQGPAYSLVITTLPGLSKGPPITEICAEDTPSSTRCFLSSAAFVLGDGKWNHGVTAALRHGGRGEHSIGVQMDPAWHSTFWLTCYSGALACPMDERVSMGSF